MIAGGGSYRLFDSLATRLLSCAVCRPGRWALQAAGEAAGTGRKSGNPLLRVVDIAEICRLAREAGAVSVVVNYDFAAALQIRWRLGADLVLR